MARALRCDALRHGLSAETVIGKLGRRFEDAIAADLMPRLRSNGNWDYDLQVIEAIAQHCLHPRAATH